MRFAGLRLTIGCGKHSLLIVLALVLTWASVLVLALFPTQVQAAEELDRYIAYRLWGYGNNNITNGSHQSSILLEADREEDIYQLADIFGEPFDTPYEQTLARSLFDKTFDENSDDWKTNLRLEGGNANLYQVSLLTGGIIAEGPFSMMAAINEQSSDGFNDNIFLDDNAIAKLTNSAQRFRLNYNSENFLSILQYSNLTHKQGDNTLSLSDLPVRITFSDLAGFENVDEEDYKLNMEWHLDEAWTIKSETHSATEKLKVTQDIDRTFLSLEAFLYSSNVDTLKQNIRLEYLNEDGEVFAFDLHYKDEQNKDAAITTGLLLAPVINVPVTLSIFSDQKVEQWEASLSKDWKFSSHSYFSAEINYLNYSLNRKELVVGSANGLVDTGGVRRVTRVNENFDEFLPEFFYNYELDSGNSLYIEWAQSYQPGGVSLNLVSGRRRPYDEEIESRFEIGFYNLTGIENVNFTLNYFYSDFKNKQVPIFGSRDNFFDVGIINANSASSYGLALDFEFNKNEKFIINSNILWQKTKYKSFENAFTNLEGNNFIDTPELQATLALTWKITSNFVLSLEEIIQSSRFSDAPNNPEDELKARYISNIKLGYEQQSWAVYLWGANITDEQFLTYKSTLSDVAVAGIAASYGLTLEVQF